MKTRLLSQLLCSGHTNITTDVFNCLSTFCLGQHLHLLPREPCFHVMFNCCCINLFLVSSLSRVSTLNAVVTIQCHSGLKRLHGIYKTRPNKKMIVKQFQPPFCFSLCLHWLYCLSVGYSVIAFYHYPSIFLCRFRFQTALYLPFLPKVRDIHWTKTWYICLCTLMTSIVFCTFSSFSQ